MRAIKPHLIATLLLLLGVAEGAMAQSLESLQREAANAQNEIRRTNELLTKNQKEQQSTQQQLQLIQRNISNRKKVISSLDKQIDVIGADIASKSDSAAHLAQSLSALRKEYAQWVYGAYKNYKLNTFLLFLFSAKDFNDATRRIAYMRHYNRLRVEKAAAIDSVAQLTNQQLTEMASKKEELDRTMEGRNKELSSLTQEENRYQKSSSTLKAKAGSLSSTLKEKQRQYDNLQNQIKRIIAEEAKRNQAANSKRSSAEIRELEQLSGRFDQNRGKLPYPVRGGAIVEGYGTHAHPTQKGIMVNNKGVNMAGEQGASVVAVFEGEVSRVFFFQGLKNSVMIRHGNYLTVYSNLESVSVKQGNQVSLGQSIGKLSQSSDDQEWVLHFEIWQETTNLNPEEWLKP